MNRTPFLIVALFFVMGLFAQDKSAPDEETTVVRMTIEAFFKAFHQRDSTAMKSVVGNDVLLQTTGRNQEGKTIFRTDKIGQLYKNIAAIPDSVQFEEKLTTWNIQIDRTMANAWVGYEFWRNGEFSHCGINSFQLVNFDGDWKIVYIIDTRGRKGCL